MDWVVLILWLMAVITFGVVIISAIMHKGQLEEVRDEVSKLGGGFTFRLIYCGGYTTVVLRLHESGKKETRVSEALGLAKGLVPIRSPDGYYLRPIRLNGWQRGRVWELTFRHETPEKLPLAPALDVSHALDEIDGLLQTPNKEARGLDVNETKMLISIFKRGKRAWDEHAVEK